MKYIFERSKANLIFVSLAWLVASGSVWAEQSDTGHPQGPALDLSVKYYDRAMTAEGVVKESHFEEIMMRRPGHVWVMRVLPKNSKAEQGAHVHDDEHEHKHFNPVLLPRHVALESSNLKLEYIDRDKKELINIVATEYENVNFDGSWVNAYFLVDPQLVAAMPLSGKQSTIAGARWHEQEMHGVFQRVLWDENKLIPLVVETGKRDGTLFRRVSVKIEPSLESVLPWKSLQGYTQKEYSDFLD